MLEYDQIRAKVSCPTMSVRHPDPEIEGEMDGRALRAISGDPQSSAEILASSEVKLGCSRIIDNLRTGLVFNVDTLCVVKALITPNTFDSSNWLDQRVWEKTRLIDFISDISADGLRLVLGASQSLIEGTPYPSRRALQPKFIRISQFIGRGLKLNPNAFADGSSQFLAGATDLPDRTLNLVLANHGRLPRAVNPLFRKALKGVLDG